MKPTKEAIELAKQNSLNLVCLEINGKYAKKDSIAFAGPMGPEMTKKVWNLMNELLDTKKRIQ
jgi:hypothetical protein